MPRPNDIICKLDIRGMGFYPANPGVSLRHVMSGTHERVFVKIVGTEIPEVAKVVFRYRQLQKLRLKYKDSKGNTNFYYAPIDVEHPEKLVDGKLLDVAQVIQTYDYITLYPTTQEPTHVLRWLVVKSYPWATATVDFTYAVRWARTIRGDSQHILAVTPMDSPKLPLYVDNPRTGKQKMRMI